MDVERYKEFYEHEWQRHEHLQSAVSIPISVVTLLAGGLALMAKGFESDSSSLVWSFWSGAGVAAVLVGVSVYLLIRSVHGYRYQRIPYPIELALHHRHLKEHYAKQGKPGLADPAFEQYLTDRYIAAADRNAVNNMKRDEYLYRANRFLIYALCLTATAGIPAGIAVKATRPKPQEIRITNLASDAHGILEARKNVERRGPDVGRGTLTRGELGRTP
jgi:hypothetical protein